MKSLLSERGYLERIENKISETYYSRTFDILKRSGENGPAWNEGTPKMKEVNRSGTKSRENTVIWERRKFKCREL